MVDFNGFKFYKAVGFGGAISANEIINATSNNLFTNLNRTDQLSGVIQFAVLYIKNTSTERMENVKVWLDSGSRSNDTNYAFWVDTVGVNGIAQTTESLTEEPAGAHERWTGAGFEPVLANVGLLKPNEYIPVWIRTRVRENAESIRDDRGILGISFEITTTGTGTPGGTGTGGTGGEPPVVPPPNPQTNVEFSIAAVGDWGCEDMTDTIVDLIKSHNVDAVISLGDCSYSSTMNCWYDAIKPIDNKQGSDIIFDTCFGNHDYDSSTKRNSIMNHFGYEKTHFRKTYANNHVICYFLDSEKDIDDNSTQYDFFKAEIEKDPDTAWKMICMHRPLYTADSDHPMNEFDQIQTFQPLMDSHKFHLILTAHIHNRQCTFPLSYNQNDPEEPIVEDSGPGPYNSDVGRFSFISGTGGHDDNGSLYDLDNTPAFNAFQDNDHNGFVLLEWSNSMQTLTCKMLDHDDNVTYQFVITK